MRIIEKLRLHLVEDAGRNGVNPPCSHSDIDAFERKYNVTLPQDLREYFLSFNGTGVLDFGISGFAFSTLDEFIPWIEEQYTFSKEEAERYKNCFVIADFMLGCWVYVIDLTPGRNTVYNVPDKKYPECIVAKNFTDFIEHYLSDSNVLM